MSKSSKAYREAAEKVDRDNLYTPLQAARLAKDTSSKKQDATVEVAIRLGVDPRKADQMVRGTVNLPHGTGKTARVLVFANAEKAEAAREAGADFVGGDELIEKVAGGWTDFDAVVATPDMMGKVGRLGRVLGPRGLMPNPKVGTVNLPNGTGKTARVLVIAGGDKAEAAREAGADYVGSDDLFEKIQGGWLDFDAVVATPDMMGKVGRLGKILGPRGLMPNPKTGTVTMDTAKAVTDIKGGKIEFRNDKHGNLHFIIGKVSFDDAKLIENYGAALEEILRLKPSASKGRYLLKGSMSTTMGPGIPLDTTRTRDLMEAASE